jgi:hypothetical protein
LEELSEDVVLRSELSQYLSKRLDHLFGDDWRIRVVDVCCHLDIVSMESEKVFDVVRRKHWFWNFDLQSYDFRLHNSNYNWFMLNSMTIEDRLLPKWINSLILRDYCFI